jgi:hypothetical protein
MRAAIAPFCLLALLPAEAVAETLFHCSFGTREASVEQEGTQLTYRFGRRGRPELVLTGNASSGTIFYHRTLYARGEDQTLRFTSGDYSYLIFNGWSAPNPYLVGARDFSGLLVLRRGRIIRRLNCREGGDFIEREIFTRLPQDLENRVPEEPR